jgi:hypothetical protein
MSEDKVRTKDSCWYVGMIYDPRGLSGVSITGPEVDGMLHRGSLHRVLLVFPMCGAPGRYGVMRGGSGLDRAAELGWCSGTRLSGGRAGAAGLGRRWRGPARLR